MLKKTNRKRIFSAIAAAAILGATLVIPANAIEEKLHIQISPVTEELELKPGETREGIFRVMNIGDEDFDYTVTVEPYYVADDHGTTDFGNMNDHTKLADWITISSTGGYLERGGTDEIKYTIKIPNDAPGGGQYAAIIAQGVNKEREEIVRTTTRVAELFYIDVDGNTNECAKILNNNVNTFMFEPPISSTSLVENCGNVHVEATYTMKVYPLFSDKEIYSNEEDPESKLVLPETKRFYTTSWTKEQGAPSIGIYTVEHTVKIGKESDTVKKLVFIFPLWLLIVILLFIGSLIFWLISRARARKEVAKESRPRARDED